MNRAVVGRRIVAPLLRWKTARRRSRRDDRASGSRACPVECDVRSVQVSSAIALAFLPFLACGACGETVSQPKSSPLDALQAGATATSRRPVASQPVDVVTAKPRSGIGALERPAALRRFFEALGRLESGHAQDDVRITQFGDSHTAADIQTATVRRMLQARFGDGGRGFVAIGRPWKLWLQDGVRVGMSSEWSPERAKLERGKSSGDGRYGLSGIGLFTRRKGARAWADLSTKASRAELSYLEHPAGGRFDVFVDGVRLVRVSTRGAHVSSAYRAFDIAASSNHKVEVRAVGDGEVRVLGMSLDHDDHGVVLDALGINGARVSTALAWDERHWTEQLRHRAPSLVVLAYGTNESTDADLAEEAYERQLVDVLGRVARAVPAASCLLLGPPDRAIPTKDGWVSASKIAEIIAVQRRVAFAAGCAFYDQRAAMGGEGAIALWAAEEPPRARKDRVHLTREGYEQLGSSFASDLMRAYANWKRDTGRAGEGAPATQELPPLPAPPEPASEGAITPISLEK